MFLGRWFWVTVAEMPKASVRVYSILKNEQLRLGHGSARLKPQLGLGIHLPTRRTSLLCARPQELPFPPPHPLSSYFLCRCSSHFLLCNHHVATSRWSSPPTPSAPSNSFLCLVSSPAFCEKMTFPYRTALGLITTDTLPLLCTNVLSATHKT